MKMLIGKRVIMFTNVVKAIKVLIVVSWVLLEFQRRKSKTLSWDSWEQEKKTVKVLKMKNES